MLIIFALLALGWFGTPDSSRTPNPTIATSAQTYTSPTTKWIRKYRGEDCESCMKQKECTKTKDGIRIVKRDPYDEERYAMDRKMQMPESKEI